MAYYYYAFSGHKWGLDRVKRGVALIKQFQTKGIAMTLLVNDFRAGLAAREFGVDDATTIETIMDIDAVAQRGDTVFIDSPESEWDSRAEQYSDLFKSLFYVTDDCEAKSMSREILLKPICNDGEDCIVSWIIDPDCFEILPKSDRVFFFFGDADYDKELLNHLDFFGSMKMEMVSGHYFFVGYEEKLQPYFDTMHEAQEYRNLICTGKLIVCASLQCALEARAAQADVIYIQKEQDLPCLIHRLEAFGIKVINGFDKKALMDTINNQVNSTENLLECNQLTISKIFDKLNL